MRTVAPGEAVSRRRRRSGALSPARRMRPSPERLPAGLSPAGARRARVRADTVSCAAPTCATSTRTRHHCSCVRARAASPGTFRWMTKARSSSVRNGWPASNGSIVRRADGGRWGKSHQQRPLLEACKQPTSSPQLDFTSCGTHGQACVSWPACHSWWPRKCWGTATRGWSSGTTRTWRRPSCVTPFEPRR